MEISFGREYARREGLEKVLSGLVVVARRRYLKPTKMSLRYSYKTESLGHTKRVK